MLATDDSPSEQERPGDCEFESRHGSSNESHGKEVSALVAETIEESEDVFRMKGNWDLEAERKAKKKIRSLV